MEKTMKIQLMSDLHFEFGWKMKLTPHKDTILVLAGDIDSRHKNLGDFIKYACDNYKEVIMVAGNHEFYHRIFPSTTPWIPPVSQTCSSRMIGLRRAGMPVVIHIYFRRRFGSHPLPTDRQKEQPD